MVATEAHFQLGLDGTVYCDGTVGYDFWTRYLDVFDNVLVVGRLSRNLSGFSIPVEGLGVQFVPIPNYVGPIQYMKNFMKLRKSIRKLAGLDGAVIIRGPGPVGNLILSSIQVESYGLEVIGDPYEVFSRGVSRHPFRLVFQYYLRWKLIQTCAQASVVSYVTEKVLQSRYPSHGRTFAVSDVSLPQEAFVERPIRFETKSCYRLVAVGSLSQMYKGPDILLNAIKIILDKGLNVEMTWLGDGTYRESMLRRVQDLGLQTRVTFTGHVPAGEGVRHQLDRADLFVMPSRTEGLPKALLEAMARGLPCIGTKVGGIPELLGSSELVSPGNSVELAEKVAEVLSSCSRMNDLSRENLERAKVFSEDNLRKKRNEFLVSVRDARLDLV